MSTVTNQVRALYTLIANGSATTPQAEISIYAAGDDNAIERAMEFAKAMNGQFYYRFTLYRTAEGENHNLDIQVLVGTISLEIKVVAFFNPPGSR